ncbi:hypothetical protein [Leptospirillum ferriphilum]|uniref:hypothetical protein n=1 Tax=Leptospirillum ferriphilum TaxID=178606 RepID=UPI0015C3816B|nr:hypothetical protein [Leptospirillum ferriphilum]
MALFLVGFYSIPLAGKDVRTENPPLPDNGKKKIWTSEEKVRIVRRCPNDPVDLADLTVKTGRIPGLILVWAQHTLERTEQTFSKEMHRQSSASGGPGEGLSGPKAGIGGLGALHRKPAVKKHRGPLTGHHGQSATAKEILKTVYPSRNGPDFPSRNLRKSLAVSNLPARTYYRWTSRSGKSPRPEGVVPKRHWSLPEEREKIVAFKRQYPLWVESGWPS